MVTVLMAILIFMGIGWQFAFEQWGLSTNDPGMGAGVFYYPVTFNPSFALAGPANSGANNIANDAIVKKLETASCTIDSTPAAYTGAYRVVVIGRN